MPTSSVDAILMASGFSRRFGEENKLLALFCGKPLLTYALELACAIPAFDKVFLVCRDPAVLRLSAQYPVVTVPNEHPERGQAESIRLGVSASRAGYYMFFPCDQPLLNKDIVSKILSAKEPGKIVEPFYDNRPGSPALFSSVFREELLGLGNNIPARSIKQKHSSQLKQIRFACDTPFLDIDRPEDVGKLEKLCRCK